MAFFIQVSVEILSIVKAIKQQKLVGNTSAHSRGAVWSLLAERRLLPLVTGFIVLHTAQQVVWFELLGTPSLHVIEYKP